MSKPIRVYVASPAVAAERAAADAQVAAASAGGSAANQDRSGVAAFRGAIDVEA
jgi:hypothetical protein